MKPSSNMFYDSTLDVLVEVDKRKNVSIFLNEVTGTIEGTVTDEIGKPLVGAEVRGLFRIGKPEVSAKTDGSGSYILRDVPRGTYYIRARAKGHMIEGVDGQCHRWRDCYFKFQVEGGQSGHNWKGRDQERRRCH